MNSIVKIVTEILPLALFFYIHKKYNIQTASIWLIVATLISVAVNYFIERKLTKIQIFSTASVCIFGLLTILTGDSKFIKIKPTIVYSILGSTILVCCFYRKYIIEHLFANNFDLPENIWRKLSTIWGLFFIFLAVLNEAVWRNFSEETWMKLKVFGFMPIIFIFIIIQIPFLIKYNRKSLK